MFNIAYKNLEMITMSFSSSFSIDPTTQNILKVTIGCLWHFWLRKLQFGFYCDLIPQLFLINQMLSPENAESSIQNYFCFISDIVLILLVYRSSYY